jgi:AcrR family transcriptional regulator
MSETVPRKRRRRKDARPQELTAAALEAFAQNGFAGTTIDDIAERADVAKGTIYRYFETKDALFEAVVRGYISPMLVQFDEISVDLNATASELLTRHVEQIYARLLDNPARRVVMQILIAEGSRFPQLTTFYYNEVIAKAKQLLLSVIQRGIDTGEFRATPALQSPEVIMGPVILAAVWRMTFEQTSPLNLKHFIAAHLDIALNGLRNRLD